MEKKNIIIAVVTLIIGLGMGYLIFGGGAVDEKHDHGGGESAEGVIWTCAMHPQVRQPEFGICPLCEMDLTKLEGDADADPLIFKMSHAAVKLSNIQTTVIGSEDSDFNGKLKV